MIGVHLHLMAFLHCWIRIPIPILTANQMVILFYAELFILHRIAFRFQYEFVGMRLESRLESKSEFVIRNKPLEKNKPGRTSFILPRTIGISRLFAHTT